MRLSVHALLVLLKVVEAALSLSSIPCERAIA
jgi:hypothetical protein